MKKYEFTGKTMRFEGHILRRYAEKWKRSLFFNEKGISVCNTDTCKAERVHATGWIRNSILRNKTFSGDLALDGFRN